MSTTILFNQPSFVGKELENLARAHEDGRLAGDGTFTHACRTWIERRTGTRGALLTPSCTAALELAALLTGVGPGDEVIVPSFTFVSTANAFAMRGATPVFVDIEPDTLNLDPRAVEAALTERVRVVVPVHYAGVSCDMDAIMDLANRYHLLVVEDAAQGILATYRERSLGTIGHLGTLSFHETKNVTCGQGGALLVNDADLLPLAETARSKGTNRSAFEAGEVNKYSWMSLGSAYQLGELPAAILAAQLEAADQITARRRSMWSRYDEAFEALEAIGRIRRPRVPADVGSNAHMYYLLMRDEEDRRAFIDAMRRAGVHCVFHYVPLHASPFGSSVGRASGPLPITSSVASRLVRLPLWLGLEPHLDRVIDFATRWLART